MLDRREFISVLAMSTMVRFQKWRDEINLMSHIVPVYVNTGDVVAPVPIKDGVIIPVTERKGANGKIITPIAIPPDVLGLVGWQLGIFSKNSFTSWAATLTLKSSEVDEDENYYISHYKARQDDIGQSTPFFLPSGYMIEPSNLYLNFKVFNEDDDYSVSVRGNAALYFVKG